MSAVGGLSRLNVNDVFWHIATVAAAHRCPECASAFGALRKAHELVAQLDCDAIDPTRKSRCQLCCDAPRLTNMC